MRTRSSLSTNNNNSNPNNKKDKVIDQNESKSRSGRSKSAMAAIPSSFSVVKSSQSLLNFMNSARPSSTKHLTSQPKTGDARRSAISTLKCSSLAHSYVDESNVCTKVVLDADIPFHYKSLIQTAKQKAQSSSIIDVPTKRSASVNTLLVNSSAKGNKGKGIENSRRPATSLSIIAEEDGDEFDGSNGAISDPGSDSSFEIKEELKDIMLMDSDEEDGKSSAKNYVSDSDDDANLELEMFINESNYSNRNRNNGGSSRVGGSASGNGNGASSSRLGTRGRVKKVMEDCKKMLSKPDDTDILHNSLLEQEIHDGGKALFPITGGSKLKVKSNSIHSRLLEKAREEEISSSSKINPSPSYSSSSSSEEESDDAEDDEEGNNFDVEFEEGKSFKSYFKRLCDLRAQGKKSVGVSENSLTAKLSSLDKDDLVNYLNNHIPVKHASEINELDEIYKGMFQQWIFELNCGFNLLFYGIGSKKTLLESLGLENQKLSKAPVLFVNGFNPACSIREICWNLWKILQGPGYDEAVKETKKKKVKRSLKNFDSDLEDEDEDDEKNPKSYASSNPSSTSIPEILDGLTRKRESCSGAFYITIVIHNIEGTNLRSPKTQNSLALLGAHPAIRLICSIDHINATLMWDKVLSSKFNWVYHEISTWARYSLETSYEDLLLLGLTQRGSGEGINSDLSLRGVLHVLNSLTSNARGIFKLLAEIQLKQYAEYSDPKSSCTNEKGRKAKDKFSDVGLDRNLLFYKCRQKFLVHHETTLTTQLTEFTDHGIMSITRGPEGNDVIKIRMDETFLGTVLDEISSNE